MIPFIINACNVIDTVSIIAPNNAPSFNDSGVSLPNRSQMQINANNKSHIIFP